MWMWTPFVRQRMVRNQVAAVFSNNSLQTRKISRLPFQCIDLLGFFHSVLRSCGTKKIIIFFTLEGKKTLILPLLLVSIHGYFIRSIKLNVQLSTPCLLLPFYCKEWNYLFIVASLSAIVCGNNYVKQSIIRCVPFTLHATYSVTCHHLFRVRARISVCVCLYTWYIRAQQLSNIWAHIRFLTLNCQSNRLLFQLTKSMQ